jgi:hypothetical protein
VFRFARLNASPEGKDVVQEVDLEDQVELFMKRQAELESGGMVSRTIQHSVSSSQQGACGSHES